MAPYRRTWTSSDTETDTDDEDDLSLFSDDDDDNDDDEEAVLYAKDIMPMDDETQQAMGEAVENIQMCHKLFSAWHDELEKYADTPQNPTRSKAVAQELLIIVKELVDHSRKALRSTKLVLRGHYAFSQAFYRAMRESAQTGRFEYSIRMEKIVAFIQEKADIVSDIIARMQESLSALSKVLEEIRANRKRARSSIVATAIKWLKGAFDVFSTLLGLGATLANILCQPHIGLALGVGSALCSKLSSILGKISSDGKLTDEQTDKLFDFLQDTLVHEVASAQEVLTKLDDCQTLLRRHLDTRGDRVFRIDKQDARTMEIKWRARHIGLRRISSC